MAKLNEFCRTCMCQFPQKTMYEIEKHQIWETHNLAEKLMQCSNLRVLPSDEYPRSLCGKCYEKILDFCEFQRMCRESLKAFREILLLERQVYCGSYTEVFSNDDASHDFNGHNDIRSDMIFDGGGDMLDSASNNDQMGELAMEHELAFDDEGELEEENIAVTQRDPPQANSLANVMEDNSCLSNVMEDNNHIIPSFIQLSNKSYDTMSQPTAGKYGDNSTINREYNSTTEETEDECIVDTLSEDEEYETRALNPKPNSKYPFHCDLCPKVFRIEHRLLAHKRLHQGIGAYPCNREKCTRTFRRLCDLQQHVKEHDGAPREIYKCDIDHCGKEYASKASINMHIRKHHNSGTRKHICDICGASLANVRTLQEHYFVHVDKSKWPFGCNVKGCTSRFRNISQLKEHKNRHYGIKPHLCPYCDKRFFTTSNLNVHINYHTLEKKWSCHLCPKVCYNSAGLRQHIRRKHSDTDDVASHFPCRMCDKILTSPTSRKHHEMVHRGENQYVCDECGCAFTQPSSLKSHKKIHSENNNSKEAAAVRSLSEGSMGRLFGNLNE